MGRSMYARRGGTRIVVVAGDAEGETPSGSRSRADECVPPVGGHDARLFIIGFERCRLEGMRRRVLALAVQFWSLLVVIARCDARGIFRRVFP